MGFLPPKTWMGRARDAFLLELMFRLARKSLRKVNEVRAELKLEPLKDIWEIYDKANRVLVMTAQAFDFKAKELPANVRYVGPQLGPTTGLEGWDSPWPSTDPRPLVLVGLSTSEQGQEPLLHKLIGVLGEMEIRALVTTGPAIDPSRFEAPANVAVRSFVPHADVMPESALIITHAGHGTVIRAMAAGVPLVCIPLGRDQYDVAARVVWHGAGVKLRAKVKPTALKRGITDVLENVSFRDAAHRLAEAISKETKRDIAIQELEELGAAH
jgi:MGT family glycosyltransferase